MRDVKFGGFVKTSILLAIALSTIPWISKAGISNGTYDLGGPCVDRANPGLFRQILQAKKDRSWDRMVELEKTSVRDGCANEYRWYELVGALLSGHRGSEALKALEEMDFRGFDLNPALISSEHSQVTAFMETPLFTTSAIGKKVARLKKTSDDRRARYRQALRALPSGEKPPDKYIAKHACPFECCRFGDWSVLNDTDLVAAPGSNLIVGRAEKGSRVTALTGEVHLEPQPVVVLTDDVLPKDSIAFVLDPTGEGYGHVYTRGKVVNVPLAYADYCFRVSESCWGETLFPSAGLKKPVWWVKVKLASGLTGWTDKAENFGNKDACA